MSTYIVGDIQGCFRSLESLLEHIGFSASDDLWCVGDLVNRGPGSLETLRFTRALGPRFRTVLGNHDLHFLAMVYGGHPHRGGDTMEALLDAPDCLELAEWLRGHPLLIEGPDYVIVHAGIPHIWDLATAAENAREVEGVVQGASHRAFFKAMYGNEPPVWDPELTGMDRHRIITNYLTRMRLVDAGGRMDFAHKGELADVPPGFKPWFAYTAQVDAKVYFGHWAALDGETGDARLIGLDTGCVWGRQLTAVRLDDGQVFAVPAVPSDIAPSNGA